MLSSLENKKIVLVEKLEGDIKAYIINEEDSGVRTHLD